MLSLSMREKPRFDGQLLKADAEDAGFVTAQRLAAATGLSDQTVLRFYSGHTQTAKTLRIVCAVLKKRPSRYRLTAGKAA